MTISYPYLQNPEFLREIDELPVKEQWVKITLLDFATEKNLGEIQGKVKNGSFNFNGKSSMRRTAQFSMVAEDDGDITNAQNLISINKKINLEVGITNTTLQYQQYPIIWYPLGLYIITEAQVNRGKENVTVSVNLKDKMCLLNGECGGTIPAAATLSEYDTIDENGREVSQKITMVQLIREIVNHYGGEQLGKIIISDLDTRVKQVMMWNGNQPLFFYDEFDPETGIHSYSYTLTEKTNIPYTKIFQHGDDIGFIYTDFTYPGQLNSVAGDTVCTVLDKIVSVLGNFEYFYDIDGNFVFQEIKNYLNNAQSTKELNLSQMSNDDYIIDLTKGYSEYDFSDSILIKTFSNNPHYNNIKNDYVVWGTRKTAEGKAYPIRFHLALDKKPSIEGANGEGYTFYLYKDEYGTKRARQTLPLEIDDAGRFNPKTGVEGYWYENVDTGQIYIWTLDKRDSDESETTGQMIFLEYPYDYGGLPEKGVVGWYYKVGPETYKCIREKVDNISINDCYERLSEPLYVKKFDFIPQDWRTALYLQGTVADPTGTDTNYYYSELLEEWPKIYDIELEEWKVDKSKMNFYLDFIDTDSKLGQLSVFNIGRRSLIIDDKNINCLFEEDVNDCIIIKLGDYDTETKVQECMDRNQAYSQVEPTVYENMVTGGTANSAYNLIKDLLYQYTSYNETVAISTIPLYHLQPGIRVTIQDTKTGIYGDYMINSISCNLEVSGTMNISCTRCLEKI